MYNKELIYRDAKQIVDNKEGILPYVIIAQPRRNLDEIPAQKLDGLMGHDIDLTGYSKGFLNIGGEKTDVARNYLMEACIDSGAKYMFFVGEDTVIPYDGFIKLHETCEKNPGCIAIGVYYFKLGQPMVMVRDGNWICTADVTPGRLPFPVLSAGMDAMLIPISILQKMKKEEPDNPFCCIVNDLHIDEETYIEFIGEDNYFYHRCSRMGIPILCNPDVQCLHMDLHTGKYTAYPDVDLANYMTSIPLAGCLTTKDRKYIADRWVDRVPDGSFGIPGAIQIDEEIEKLLEYVEGKKLILEIGTYMGGTLYKFIHAADPAAEIVTINFLDETTGKQPDEKEMQGWKLPNQALHIIKADSHSSDTLEQVKTILNGRKFDFMFIDGDHTYDGVKKDYDMYHEYAKMIAFHDIVIHPTFAPGVKPFWDELTGNKIEIIKDPKQQGFGIGILIQE